MICIGKTKCRSEKGLLIDEFKQKQDFSKRFSEIIRNIVEDEDFNDLMAKYEVYDKRNFLEFTCPLILA